MKLIPLDQVERIIDEYRTSPTDIMQEIDSIPTIDPVEIIEEMIRESCSIEGIDALQELKSRLSHNPSSHV